MANIMFFGDIHGDLDTMYENAQNWEKEHDKSIDLIVQVGDFEVIRSENDLKFVIGPKKYRKLGDFHKYHSGDKEAPIKTLFIGGNHEDYDFLDQFIDGVEVAQDIAYLGRSGVIEAYGLKIGFLSGIDNGNKLDPIRKFNKKDGNLHSNKTRRKAIYFTQEDIDKIYGKEVDILVTHDPAKHLIYGRDVTPVDHLLLSMKPKYFFAGHMHLPKSKTIEYDGGTIQANVLAHVNVEGSHIVLNSEQVRNQSTGHTHSRL